MIRVLLVDDEELIRVGFQMVLEVEEDLEVVGEVPDGERAVELLRTTPVDVVLMDVQMPGMGGVEATRRICAGPLPAPEPAPRVLVLTTFDLDEYAFQALRAGASGFLLKNSPPADLVSAIRAVHAGDAVVAPSTTRRLLDRFTRGPRPAPAPDRAAALPGLTAREHEVLELVARGMSNAEIAAHLVVAEPTVKTHVSRILAKCGLRDRVQAVVLAYESGLVGPAPR